VTPVKTIPLSPVDGPAADSHWVSWPAPTGSP
jgi:hypothetical protein